MCDNRAAIHKTRIRKVPMPDNATVSRLRVSIQRATDVATVRCSGRLVSGVNGNLYDEVRQLFPDHRRIVLDFTELAHIDSSGIGTLVRLYVSAKSAGCILELINVGKPIRHLLGVTHLWAIFGSVGENKIRMG